MQLTVACDRGALVRFAACTEGRQLLHVNGLFRHGFLLAPVLAKIVADYLETGQEHLLMRGGCIGARDGAHPGKCEP